MWTNDHLFGRVWWTNNKYFLIRTNESPISNVCDLKINIIATLWNKIRITSGSASNPGVCLRFLTRSSKSATFNLASSKWPWLNSKMAWFSGMAGSLISNWQAWLYAVPAFSGSSKWVRATVKACVNNQDCTFTVLYYSRWNVFHNKTGVINDPLGQSTLIFLLYFED